MAQDNGSAAATTIGIIALIVGLIALIWLWMAYGDNRTNQYDVDLEQVTPPAIEIQNDGNGNTDSGQTMEP